MDKKSDKPGQEIIDKLCELCGVVGCYFSSQYAYDCFCSERTESNPLSSFRHEGEILDFIKAAILEKIERDGKPKSRWEEEEEND